AAQTLGFVLSRMINHGMHEDLDVTNYGQKPVRVNLEVAVRADFADTFDVKAHRNIRRGHIRTDWSESEQRIVSAYRNRDFHRAVTIAVKHGDPYAVYANGRLSFEITLRPGEIWHCCLLYHLTDGDTVMHASPDCAHHTHQSRHAAAGEDWQRSV